MDVDSEDSAASEDLLHNPDRTFSSIEEEKSFAYELLNNKRNAVLKGEPGTGKTTVAKIYQLILYGMGIDCLLSLEPGQASDFIAGYEGQTQLKAKQEMNRCIGTTKFYDESYQIVEKKGENVSSAYGSEAITVIMQSLSQPWGVRTVIFAGYPDKMENFLASNEGLRRRMKSFWYLQSVPRELLQERFRKIYQSLDLENWFPNLTESLFMKHVTAILTELYKPSAMNGNKHWIQNQNYTASDIFKAELSSNIRYYNKIYVQDQRNLERSLGQYNEEKKKVIQNWKAKHFYPNQEQERNELDNFLSGYPRFWLPRNSQIYQDKEHIYKAAWTVFVQQITNDKIPINFEDADFVSDEEQFEESKKKAQQFHFNPNEDEEV